MKSLINLFQISKSYNINKNELSVLKGITLQINQGEMVAIMGTSGSGKSTLMNIMGFLDDCTTGKYYFSGTDVTDLKPNDFSKIRSREIGFVFQSFFLLSRLNILKNVMLPLIYTQEDKIVAKEKALSMLKKVGMSDFIHHKPNQLSGGQQQRVAIARALVNNPRIILADEPTGALDSKTGHEIMELFHRLHKDEKRTIVIITHDKEISSQCERNIILKDGSII